MLIGRYYHPFSVPKSKKTPHKMDNKKVMKIYLIILFIQDRMFIFFMFLIEEN